MIVSATFLIAFAVGCTSGYPPTPVSPALSQTLAAKSIPFRSLIIGEMVGPADNTWHAVLRTKDEQDTFWRSLAHQQYPRPVLPPLVDFEKEQGVMVLLGSQPTGMNWCEVVAISEQPHQFTVHTVLWKPPPEMSQTHDLGNPWHYVAMPRTTKPVVFAPVVEGTYDHRPSTLPKGVMSFWDLPSEAVPTPGPTSSLMTRPFEPQCVVNPDTSARQNLQLIPSSPCLGQKVTIRTSSVDAEWANVALIRASDGPDLNFPVCSLHPEWIGGGPVRSGEFTFEFEVKQEIVTASGEVLKLAPGNSYTVLLTPLVAPDSTNVVFTKSFSICDKRTLRRASPITSEHLTRPLVAD